MRAYSLIRPGPIYRREAFDAGLKAAGLDLRKGSPMHGDKCDVLVIWNRYGDNHNLACRVEAGGGRVIVAENGYVGRDANGHQLYAIAEGGHNGSGKWPDRAGGSWLAETETYGARWRALGIELGRIQSGGKHILVCPNRSFGRPDFIMPTDWAERTAEHLKKFTDRPIRIRPHPGNWQSNPPKVPLSADLEGAHAMVIWASSAGVHALVAGVQVICTAPFWILKGAAPGRIEEVDQISIGEREPAFERLAWAQWTLAEISSGEPFKRLLA